VKRMAGKEMRRGKVTCEKSEKTGGTISHLMLYDVKGYEELTWPKSFLEKKTSGLLGEGEGQESGGVPEVSSLPGAGLKDIEM